MHTRTNYEITCSEKHTSKIRVLEKKKLFSKQTNQRLTANEHFTNRGSHFLSNYLSFSDKLNLACVCKKWYEKLSQTTLYKKLVSRDMEEFDKAVELCNKKNFVKQQVRDLV
jgi:uncharacterized protein YxjI